MRAVAGAHFSEERLLNDMLTWHRLHHPVMEAQDVAKLYFQAILGCGHLLGDEKLVEGRIRQEMQTLTPSTDEPLTEPLGPTYVRLNLRAAKAMNISPLWIARMMKQSMPKDLPARSLVADALKHMEAPGLTPYIDLLTNDPHWLPSHTPAYHAAYAPAYRVISRCCAAMLPVVSACANHSGKEKALLCIDGPCGSGKSTLAGMLASILDAAVVPMDDFFLPHPMKTPQRLAQTGGNADWERLVQEVVTPWLRGDEITYRPYDCHAGDYASPVHVPGKRFTIIEGSYSLLPAIGKHADVRVFLSINEETQRRRILARNGERMLNMFIQRWIPLEQAYFKAYRLPDESCLVLSVPEQA